uniref:Uncharacterized protein n=1 Tax=Arundo donax TaxID=35708 RepID=A0A0A9CN45_ARUDO
MCSPRCASTNATTTRRPCRRPRCPRLRPPSRPAGAATAAGCRWCPTARGGRSTAAA